MNSTAKPSQIAPTPIRLPEELKAWLKKEAEANHRSLNGEVIARLDASRQAVSSAKKVKGQVAPTTQPLDETPIPSKGKEISHGRG